MTASASQQDFTAGLQASALTAFGNNLAQNRWAIKGFTTDQASISDLLRGTTGTVECSSCHDPHFKNTGWDEIECVGAYKNGDGTCKDPSEIDGLFLRRVGGNTGSGVCRTCHNK